MNNILLLTHFGWGMTLLKSVESIIGKTDFVTEIPLEAEMTLGEYQDLIIDYLEGKEDNTLIMVDMFGGTPSTVSALIARDYPVEVLCGLNSPMLLTACSKILFNGTVSINTILEEAQNSIFDVSVKVGLKGDL